MGTDFDIRLEGFEALDRRLSSLPARIERSVFRKSLRSTGTKLARKIKAGTPKVTGSARKSVKVKVKVRRGGAYAVIGYTKRPKAQMRWLEMGTARQPARPFFEKIVGPWRAEASREFNEALTREVEKAEAI